MTFVGRPGLAERTDLECVGDRLVHCLVLGLQPRAARRQPVRAKALENLMISNTAPALQFPAAFDQLRKLAEETIDTR